jgi:uroporphyrinogen-III synthase
LVKWGARVVDRVDERAASVLRRKTIFVSRAREQCSDLCAHLESSGAQVIASPLLQFALPEDLVPLDAALQALGEFDWWLITSQHAVEFAASRCDTLGVELTELARAVRVGAVGVATAETARRAGIAVEYVAKQQSAAGLAEELAAKVARKRVLLLRSNLADSALPASLAAHGAAITDVIAYRTLPPADEERKRLAAISWEYVDAAIFFSPSAIRLLADAIGTEKMKEISGNAVSVAVGPTTAEAARKHGFERCVQAEEPSSAAVAHALEECFAHRQSQTQSKKMTGAHRG